MIPAYDSIPHDELARACEERGLESLWEQDEAWCLGEYVSFERIFSWPKLVQKPHPPVLVGGNGRRVLERELEYGDGWLPQPKPSRR